MLLIVMPEHNVGTLVVGGAHPLDFTLDVDASAPHPGDEVFGDEVVSNVGPAAAEDGTREGVVDVGAKGIPSAAEAHRRYIGVGAQSQSITHSVSHRIICHTKAGVPCHHL